MYYIIEADPGFNLINKLEDLTKMVSLLSDKIEELRLAQADSATKINGLVNLVSEQNSTVVDEIQEVKEVVLKFTTTIEELKAKGTSPEILALIDAQIRETKEGANKLSQLQEAITNNTTAIESIVEDPTP
jgi:predicted  nucleic acid-binding Zn-ribbon protein